ncbi:hypothetical protein FZC66_15395 [Priestia megaterium]|nr:hypothetical protein FZC66_15395 [Priestia megaterium]
MSEQQDGYVKRKLGKIILLLFMIVTAVFFISQLLFVIFAGVGSEKSRDIALFAGNRYAIVEEESSFRLYDKKTRKLILDDVNGYYANNSVYSYVKNETEYVIINEQEEEYVKKTIDQSTEKEQAFFNKFTPLKHEK